MTATAYAEPYAYTFTTVGGEPYTLVGEQENGIIELAGIKPGDAASTLEIKPLFTYAEQSGGGEFLFAYAMCKELGMADDPVGFGWGMVVAPVSGSVAGYALDLGDSEPEVYESTAVALPYFYAMDGAVLVETLICSDS